MGNFFIPKYRFPSQGNGPFSSLGNYHQEDVGDEDASKPPSKDTVMVVRKALDPFLRIFQELLNSRSERRAEETSDIIKANLFGVLSDFFYTNNLISIALLCHGLVSLGFVYGDEIIGILSAVTQGLNPEEDMFGVVDTGLRGIIKSDISGGFLCVAPFIPSDAILETPNHTNRSWKSVFIQSLWKSNLSGVTISAQYPRNRKDGMWNSWVGRYIGSIGSDDYSLDTAHHLESIQGELFTPGFRASIQWIRIMGCTQRQAFFFFFYHRLVLIGL